MRLAENRKIHERCLEGAPRAIGNCLKNSKMSPIHCKSSGKFSERDDLSVYFIAANIF